MYCELRDHLLISQLLCYEKDKSNILLSQRAVNPRYQVLIYSQNDIRY